MATDYFQDVKRFGIFGPSESGKTTLAKKIARRFQAQGIWTVALDPMQAGNWGEKSYCLTNEKQFWDYIWKVSGCLIVVDDASKTIDGDKDLSPVFTALRHQNHKLLVIGHHATNLSPQMRDQLQVLFLFLQNDDSVKTWKRIFPRAEIDQATGLNQYEFLAVANYKPTEKFLLSK